MFVGIAAMVAGLVSPVLAVERDGGSSSRPEFLTGLETPTTRPAIAIEPIPGPQAVAPAEPVRGFSDLTQGDGLGLRTQFLAVGSTVAEPTSRPTTPPATVPPPGTVPIGLIGGLAFLGILGGAMWYVVRQRGR